MDTNTATPRKGAPEAGPYVVHEVHSALGEAVVGSAIVHELSGTTIVRYQRCQHASIFDVRKEAIRYAGVLNAFAAEDAKQSPEPED